MDSNENMSLLFLSGKNAVNIYFPHVVVMAYPIAQVQELVHRAVVAARCQTDVAHTLFLVRILFEVDVLQHLCVPVRNIFSICLNLNFFLQIKRAFRRQDSTVKRKIFQKNNKSKEFIQIHSPFSVPNHSLIFFPTK